MADVLKTLSEFLCKLSKRFWVYKAMLASSNKWFIISGHFLRRCWVVKCSDMCTLKMGLWLNKQKSNFEHIFFMMILSKMLKISLFILEYVDKRTGWGWRGETLLFQEHNNHISYNHPNNFLWFLWLAWFNFPGNSLVFTLWVENISSFSL